MKTFIFPGQGSQKKGMGKLFFAEFEDIVKVADAVLGYSIKALCLSNLGRKLNQTEFTQPALYTVNALHYLKKIQEDGKSPDYLAGHSLGEYNALFAAGAFDFATGLQLVKKRGELMSKASGGGMAAIIGLTADRVTGLLQEHSFSGIDVANYNSPSQLILSGEKNQIDQAKKVVEDLGARYVYLNVSAAFHSRLMQPAQDEFSSFLQDVTFGELNIPVIANVNAKPYLQNEIKTNLITQITNPVRWSDSMYYLMELGDMDFMEIGPGNVLTKLITKINAEPKPQTTKARPHKEIKTDNPVKTVNDKNDKSNKSDKPASTANVANANRRITMSSLGSREFKTDYNVDYTYVTGGMYRGIASKELVVRMGRAKMLSFLGTGGMSLAEIERCIRYIKQELNQGQPYGMNLLNNFYEPQAEEDLVDLLLRCQIRHVEAAAYMQNLSPALIRFRLTGLQLQADNRVILANTVMAKVSRPEVAQAFLSPPPQKIVDKLLEQGLISAEQAALAAKIPMADDICVEADSGGHTDQGVAYALMPAMIALRDAKQKQYNFQKKIRIGAAGGIGAPESAAAAFILGADFILTGSINQCTVEAATSDSVKDLLQQMNVQDTAYAPAGDMFELGSKVQVLRKGLFFPVRANKLYDLYQQYNSLDEIDEKTQQQIQDKYFKRSFDEVYAATKIFFQQRNPAEIEKAERNPKHKMALIFRWYFAHSTELALSGDSTQKVDYQVQTGPALGAFNQWVKDTELEDWRNRHVDNIAIKLMQATASLLNQRFQALQGE